MSIQGPGLTFFPLYWTFHDNWRYYFVPTGGGPPSVFDHYGHTHLFLMGFDPTKGSQDAWSGKQTYRFRLDDIWGPRSVDPNQQQQYRIVGTPKWYIHIQEIWRRMYIHQWDSGQGGELERRGVKWDACEADKTSGPFREGRGFSPAFIENARTLPLDYFATSPPSQAIGSRSNWLASQAQKIFSVTAPGTSPPYDPSTYNTETYDLQHGNYLRALEDGGHVAGVPTFSDNLYIWPIMEYQRVVQSDWARPPGFEARDINDESFGDGFELAVEVPFQDPATSLYRSPFCAPGTRVVQPVGQYFNNLVSDDHKPRHATVNYNDPEVSSDDPYYYDNPGKLPPSLSGQPVTWHNPYGANADGYWVQQCLGGIVQAKAKVTIEHKLGGRKEIWVHTNQLVPTTPFAGTDQMLPGAES